jgi:hypothetical protein
MGGVRDVLPRAAMPLQTEFRYDGSIRGEPIELGETYESDLEQ